MKKPHTRTQNAPDSTTPNPRKRKQKAPLFPGWPRTATVGRTVVRIYKRLSPAGHPCYMVGNYSTGVRRWDCYHDEAKALEEAATLTRRVNDRDTQAAPMPARASSRIRP